MHVFAEIIDFINASREAGARWIVTTEKDAVRLPELGLSLPIRTLRIDAALEDDSRLRSRLAGVLERAA